MHKVKSIIAWTILAACAILPFFIFNSDDAKTSINSIDALLILEDNFNGRR